MMHKSLLTVVGLALVVGGCGSSRPVVPLRDNTLFTTPTAMLRQYVTSADGSLGRDELIKGLRAEFDTHDTTRSGCLLPDAVADLNAARVQANQSVADLLRDWNGNGCVDFQEFSATPLSLFSQMDTEGEGRLTQRQLNPVTRAPAARRAPSAQPPLLYP